MLFQRRRIIRRGGGAAAGHLHRHPVALTIVAIIGGGGGVGWCILPVDEAPFVVIAELCAGLRARTRRAAGGRTAEHIACGVVARRIAACRAGGGVQVRAVAIAVAAARWASGQAVLPIKETGGVKMYSCEGGEMISGAIGLPRTNTKC